MTDGGIMSTAARKARKRAGIKLIKPAKSPTYRWVDVHGHTGLGLTSGAEVIAGIVIRGAL